MTVKLFIERRIINSRLKAIVKLESIRDSEDFILFPHEKEYLVKEISRRYQTLTDF